MSSKSKTIAAEKVVFILNPQSAGGATRRRFERTRGIFQSAFPSMEVLLTNAPGHASELTAAAIHAGASILVAVGGDGTVNEVANGFFDQNQRLHNKKAALAVFTSGTGGDFRKTFGWSLDAQETLNRIKRKKIEKVDVGQMWCTTESGQKRHRMWVNIASFGLSGAVDEEVLKSNRNFGGKAAYAMATVRAMMRHKVSKVKLTFDNESTIQKDISLLALGNGQYFGGGMWIAPEASTKDGLLDEVAFGNLGPSFWLSKGLKVYKGQHLKLKEVHHRRCQRLLAEPVNDEKIKIDLDGELPGHLPAEFSVLKQALPLII